MWTNEEFWMRASKCWNQYQSQEDWFKDWRNRNADLYILAGLKMYRSVSLGGLMPLLGDAKIRQDGTLVGNFGLASGSGSEDQKMIDKLNKDRKDIAHKSIAPAIPVSGSGSILNDKKWSPLVNDSFILGGVHRGMEFHLALQDFDQFDQELQNRRQAFGPVAPQYAAARVRTPEYYQQKWKVYLIANPEVLWNGSFACPRIFARELIGLKTFGYVPSFNFGGLGFRPGSGGGNADFFQYLTALREAGFATLDKARILSSISGFLFGDAKGLN